MTVEHDPRGNPPARREASGFNFPLKGANQGLGSKDWVRGLGCLRVASIGGVYICIHTYVYIHTFVYIHRHIYIHIYIYMYIYMIIYVYVRVL